MKITPEAEEDIENLDIDSYEMAQRIKQELSDPIDRDKIKVVRKPAYDAVFQRFKLKDEDFDHRIFFDYIDSELYVFAVRHRDHAYEKGDMKEAIERLKEL
jgi:mRNA-degrading endonuclease RelE of RelBE toxin-antitoxin system